MRDGDAGVDSNEENEKPFSGDRGNAKFESSNHNAMPKLGNHRRGGGAPNSGVTSTFQQKSGLSFNPSGRQNTEQQQGRFNQHGDNKPGIVQSNRAIPARPGLRSHTEVASASKSFAQSRLERNKQKSISKPQDDNNVAPEEQSSSHEGRQIHSIVFCWTQVIWKHLFHHKQD